MSHYTKIATCFKVEKYLLAALKDVGFGDVEVHAIPQNLYGYQGDMRADKAEIIIRRKYISSSSNDIGFMKNADGVYEANISEFDRTNKDLKYDEAWVAKVAKRYAYHATTELLQGQGFEVQEEIEDSRTGTLKLTLKRMTF
jgi:Protein of unknown function (DUF1257)